MTKPHRVRVIARYTGHYNEVGEVLDFSDADSVYVRLVGYQPMWFLKEEVEDIDD